MPGRDPTSYPPAVPLSQLAAGRVAFVAGVVGLAFAGAVTLKDVKYDPDDLDAFLLGAAAGLVAFLARKHPYRIAGIIPYASLAWFAASAVMYFTGTWAGWVQSFLGTLTLLAAMRFVGTFRPTAIKWDLLILVGFFVGFYFASRLLLEADPTPPKQRTIKYLISPSYLLVLTGVIALVTWVLLPRPIIEASLEFLLAPRYKIRGVGPGVAAFPTRGPVLVVSNHAAYLDPLFLAKDIPRPITAMMTALFYDRPIIRQLMVYFYDTIRVREVAVRKDAPELREAVGSLDAGKCVVIFPEGFLRRSEEVPLRRFGRGVWHILKDRPDTPVVACWIEGGWGSYFSFKDGPPTKNKPKEFRRLIRLGYSAPIVVPPEVLADHLATRIYLMNRVNEARAHLGLELLPEATLPQRGEADAGEETGERG